MKKSVMMKAAHKIAKEIVYKTKNYSIALSFAMKYVWNAAKNGKKRFGDVAIMFATQNLTTTKAERESIAYVEDVGYIPAWVAQNNLDSFQLTLVQNYKTGAKVIKETEKAVDVCFTTAKGIDVYMWCPKSVISD